MKYFIILVFLIQIFYVQSPIPNWDITSQSKNLLSSTSSYDYIIYSKTAYRKTVILKKKITKSERSITSKNYVTIDSTTQEVEFDDIDSHYTSKLGCTILICPRGKFHPYNFTSNSYVIPSGFSDTGGWDLRCYDHYTGYFYMFYLLNNGNNFFYKYTGGINEKTDYIYSYFYDYILENGNLGDHQYKFCYLKYDCANGGVIRLCPKSLSANLDNGDVNQV